MSLKKITNNKIEFFGIIFFLGVFFLGCNNANAATLQINSTTSTFAPGSITTLSVVLNSEGEVINNAEAKIIFPADLLEVVSISKSNSVFSLWVEEPAYSNIAGTISFNGGVPTPGFNGSNGKAISIVVKAKKSGQADIIFSDAAVRANDGLGTDVLRVKSGKTLSIIKNEETTIIETETPKPQASIMALQVTSPTHPSQELWYKNNKPTFKWKVPSGVDSIQTGISDSASGLPKVLFTPAISERTLGEQKEGIWYFSVRARKNGQWGPVSTYTIKIDNTIPQKNEVLFSYDDKEKILTIESDIIDDTSGLDHYEIFINDLLYKNIPSGDFANGIYNLEVDFPGYNTVKLVAFDRAGNSTESLGSFNSITTTKQNIDPIPAPNKPLLISVGSYAIPVIYFILGILSLILLLVLVAFKLGRSYSKLRNGLKVRNAIVKGDNKKLLLLLKKRLEKHLEILQNTRHNRILSKEEKEIKEAIEGDLDEVDRAIEKQKEE